MGALRAEPIASGAMRSLSVAGLAALVALSATWPSRLATAGEMDLGGYVLLWATGPYASPVICQLPGGPRRVARNLSIKPPRRNQPRAKHKLTIEPIGMGDARCTNEFGAAEVEIEGVATLSFVGPKRPDTARRDFEHELRREGGFELNVESGRLKVGVGEAQSLVDLKGGTLRISRVPPGSDAARILGDVGGLPTRTLELEAPDGTRFVFLAVQVIPKKPS